VKVSKKGQIDVHQIQRVVTPLAQRYKIGQVYLFGSYARGDMGEDSDVDLCIGSAGHVPGLFELAGFRRQISEQLNLPVDIAFEDGAYPEVLEEINRDRVILYEETNEK